MPNPVASFRVYPGKANCMAKKRNLYFDVYVMATERQMFKKCDELCPENKNHDFAAMVVSFRRERFRRKRGAKRKSWVTSPALGFALFHKRRLHSEVVSHESLHMAVAFCDREKPFVLKSCEEARVHTEERVAHATGSAARQLVNGFYKFKLYDR